MTQYATLPLFGETALRTTRTMAAYLLFTATDLFCGAGGTTTGFEAAKFRKHKIVATRQVVNHDALAIASHTANHAAAKHFTEDITKLDANLLVRTSILWASLECTNFSNAKGGQSRDADSRSLAEHMERYIRATDPLYFFVENVREFMSWGPLYHKKGKDGELCYRRVKVMADLFKKNGQPRMRKNGKPVQRQVVDAAGQLVWENVPVMIPESRTKGRDFLRWKQSIEDLGYSCHYKTLNAADYGERTSRVRLFMIFAKNGLPVRWPEASHSDPRKNRGLTVGTLPWLPVRPCLRLEKKGRSIFERTKLNKHGELIADDLVEKTLKRIYAGLCKYIAGSDVATVTKFLADLAAGNVGGRQPQTEAERAWLLKRSSNPPSGAANPGASLDEPAPTVATCFHPDLVQAEFVKKGGAWLDKRGSNPPSGKPNPGVGLDQVAPTITTCYHPALVQPEFIVPQFTQGAPSSLDEPVGTVTANPRARVAQVEFLAKAYTGNPEHLVQGTDVPSGAITCVDHHQLVQGEFLTMRHNTDLETRQRSLDDTALAITTKDHHTLIQAEFLTNPGWQGDHSNSGIDEPSQTIVARQDKVPLSLVQPVPAEFLMQSNGGPVASKVTPSSAPARTVLASPNQSLVQVEGAEAAFLTQYNGGADDSRNLSLKGPANTITTENRFGLLQTEPVGEEFLQKYYGSGDNCTSTADPAGTLTTKDRMALVQTEAAFLDKRYGSGEHNHQSLDAPAGAITTNDHHAVVQTVTSDCLIEYFGNSTAKGLDETAGALLTTEKLGLVQTEGLSATEWLDRRFGSGDHNHLSVDSAAGTVTTNDNHGLAQVIPIEPYLLNTSFDNAGSGLHEVAPTLTASRHHPYLAQPEPWLVDNKFDNVGRPLTEPGPTLLTGDHHYLATPQAGSEPRHWQEQADDNPTLRLIRQFMRAYGLADILLRMLMVEELLQIQGFPADYVLLGSTTDQKKFIGNSVPPKMSQRIVEAIYEAIDEKGLLHLLEQYQDDAWGALAA